MYRHRDIIKDCSILNLIDFRRNIPLTNSFLYERVFEMNEILIMVFDAESIIFMDDDC